ncbi:MAG TPA: hypothetical protein VJ483_07240 [Holophagaceae bacterium]|nr:hypothetical protein [Holophagaceae bacterium]
MPKALQRRSFFGWMAAVPATLAVGQVARAAEPLAAGLAPVQEPASISPLAPTEKEMKDLQDQLKLLREAKLPQAVEPAFTFAAMKRGRR